MSFVLTSPQAGKDVGQLHDTLVRAGLVPEIVQSDGVTIWLTFPDGTAEAAVSALIAAHIPQTRYDPATQLAAIALVRGRARRRADLERLQHSILGAATFADGVVVFNELLDVLRKRDREAGVV